jgi:hypothetical protein
MNAFLGVTKASCKFYGLIEHYPDKKLALLLFGVGRAFATLMRPI